jgi:hypothetical protein
MNSLGVVPVKETPVQKKLDEVSPKKAKEDAKKLLIGEMPKLTTDEFESVYKEPLKKLGIIYSNLFNYYKQQGLSNKDLAEKMTDFSALVYFDLSGKYSPLSPTEKFDVNDPVQKLTDGQKWSVFAGHLQNILRICITKVLLEKGILDTKTLEIKK